MTSITFGDTNSGLQAGIVIGTVNAQFYLPAKPETPPSPLSTVPFRRDPDFVSREALLDQIHKKISVPGSRIALVGVGGVGKSQLSIEYSYRVRYQSPATWVFWVHGSNAGRFEQSFRDIADQAKILGRQDPNVNIYQLVESWLRDGTKGKWLLILDNVDDDAFLRQPLVKAQQGPTKPLLEFLPQSPNGSVMITSRSQEVAFKLVDHQDIIQVQPMNKPEALNLLQRKLGHKVETPDMQMLVEELEFMPLAIIQAAGYIVHREPRCSVSQYLEMFKSDREATKLLDYEAGHHYRDREANNSIMVTWQISFDHIRRIRPSAADLLSLMSFFDRQGVAENLLRVPHATNNEHSSYEEIVSENSDRDVDSTPEFNTDHDFEDDVTTLRDFSFVYVKEDRTTFTMHRLVQLSVRLWLTANGQTEQCMNQFMAIMCYKFPTGEYENWAQCRALFPHVKAAVSQRPESHESLRQWATLLYKGAWYAQKSGNIVESRDMAFMSRNKRLEILGAEDEETLDSTTVLAAAYRLEGRWEEAEQLEVQVIETRKIKLGADHPFTLTSIGNLAATYRNQGRWEEAERLEVQVMEAYKRTLSADDRNTLNCMANLALTYMNQGRWEEAERLEVQVIEAFKIKLGADHPNTLTSMGNLALTYMNQGRWEEAEQLNMQVIETRKIKLATDHPDTLASMGNLASTYMNQGRWEEAEQLYMQVMEAFKIKLGVDHPQTLLSMHNLAYTFRSLGQYTAAVQLMAECVQLSDRKLGPDHPGTISSKSALNEWRGKVNSPHSQLTKPTDTEDASIRGSSTETSKRVSRPSGHYRRTILLRLFGRK